MTVTVKSKTPLVIPPSVWRRAGIRPGEKVELNASSGVITITAKPEDAADEYTPAQRKRIDARLAVALKQVDQGRVIGPFETAQDFVLAIRGELRKRRAAKKPVK